MPRPAVIFGGHSPEHDISILSGLQSARALDGAGLDPLAVYWGKNGDFHLVPARLEASDYLTGRTPTPVVAAEAAVHSYTTAFLWGAGFFLAGAVISGSILRPGVRPTGPALPDAVTLPEAVTLPDVTDPSEPAPLR